MAPPLQISADAEQLHALELIAYLHLRHGNPARADVYYRFLLSIQEPTSRVYCAAAAARLAVGQLDEALALTEQSLALPSEARLRAAVYLIRSRILTAQGRDADSATAVQQFLQEQTAEK